MNHRLRTLAPAALLVVMTAACAPGVPDTPQTQALDMTAHDLDLAWAVTRDQELPCGGDEMGGGALVGDVTFAELGTFAIDFSAAWDIAAANPDPAEAEFEPSDQAGGPFAPVFGPNEHPYQFQYDPFTDTCGDGPTATGEVALVDGAGARIDAEVTGGETHRLDFVVEGDGIETFATVDIIGGTGRFAGATGSFTVHMITRFDFGTSSFVIDLAEVLAGGSITF